MCSTLMVCIFFHLKSDFKQKKTIVRHVLSQKLHLLNMLQLLSYTYWIHWALLCQSSRYETLILSCSFRVPVTYRPNNTTWDNPPFSSTQSVVYHECICRVSTMAHCIVSLNRHRQVLSTHQQDEVDDCGIQHPCFDFLFKTKEYFRLTCTIFYRLLAIQWSIHLTKYFRFQNVPLYKCIKYSSVTIGKRL